MRTRDLKALAEEKVELEYDEAKADAFRQELNDEMKDMETEEMDIDFFQGFLDSFTFSDAWDWAYAEVDNELNAIGDAKYEQMRDERIVNERD